MRRRQKHGANVGFWPAPFASNGSVRQCSTFLDRSEPALESTVGVDICVLKCFVRLLVNLSHTLTKLSEHCWPVHFVHTVSDVPLLFMCRWDGDKTAFDPEYEDSETRDAETDLRLGQPIKRPTDGEKCGSALLLVGGKAWCFWGCQLTETTPINVIIKTAVIYFYPSVSSAINEMADCRKEVELIQLVFLDQAQKFPRSRLDRLCPQLCFLSA